MDRTDRPTSVRTAVDETVGRWEGVSSAPHRFGGVEYRAGGRELGHLHGDRLADILVPHRVHDRVIAEGRAETHHVLPRSNWISVYIRRPEQVDDVISLFRLAYEQAMQHPLGTRKRREGVPVDGDT